MFTNLFNKKQFGVVQLYTFDQLAAEIQSKIIVDTRARFAADVDYDFDISSFLVDAEDKGLFVTQDDISFSIGGILGNGNGVNFVTDRVDFRKIMEDNGFLNRFSFLRVKQNLDEIIDGLQGRIYRVDSETPYKNTSFVDVTYSGERKEQGIEIAYALRVTIGKIKNELCDRLLDNLLATYENELSDKNIHDFYLSDCLFFTDGTRVNPEILDNSEAAKQAKSFMELPARSQVEIGDMIDKEASKIVNFSFGRL